MKLKFTVNAKTKSAEVLIYEDIGDGWLGGVSAKGFVEELNGLGELSEINVRINSDGGSVFDGLAIYNALVRHPANIKIHIDGIAASIASVIAMAGDEINMSKNAWLMIHDPWTVAGGTAGDLRSQADLLDKIRNQLLETYKIKTGLDADKISDYMTNETWFEGGEALELGFVDNITDDLAIAAHSSCKKYKNAPSVLINSKNKTTVPKSKTDNDASVVSKMRDSLKARNL